jgi:hypothetical protein
MMHRITKIIMIKLLMIFNTVNFPFVYLPHCYVDVNQCIEYLEAIISSDG